MSGAAAALVKRFIPPAFLSHRIYDELAEVPPPWPEQGQIPAATFAQARKSESGERVPQAIAHRGYKAKLPENTLEAFQGAVEVGVDALETDIHLTRDGVVVLSHDPDLKRCFGREENIIDVDWDFLRTVRTVREPGLPMPRLDELLAYLAEDSAEAKGREDVWVMLDIKMDNDAKTVMKRIAETIAASRPHPRRPWEQRIVLGVWAYKYLPLCARYLPGFPVAYIGFSTTYAERFLVRKHASVAFNMLTQSLYMQRSFVRRAHDADRPVYAWTVNTDEWMRWCLAQGLDGVISDDPRRFIEIRREWEQGRGRRDVATNSTGWRQAIFIWFLLSVFGLILRLRLWKRGKRVDGKGEI